MRFFRKATEPVSDSLQRETANLSEREGVDLAEGLADAARLDQMGLMKALVVYRQQPIACALSTIGRRYSILHLDVLILLYYLAGHLSGEVLEIGPYIGGSTIASAKGVRDAGRACRFLTIENGGCYHHPTLPSRDILADLKNNLTACEVNDLVQVVSGGATSKDVVEQVRAQLPARSVGLFIMDADGAISEATGAFDNLLVEGCWLVIDDYYAKAEVAIAKARRTRSEVEILVLEGALEPYGLFGWGTWIGRWRGSGLPNE